MLWEKRGRVRGVFGFCWSDLWERWVCRSSVDDEEKPEIKKHTKSLSASQEHTVPPGLWPIYCIRKKNHACIPGTGIFKLVREKWRKNVKIIISTAKKKDEECKLCILRNKACFTFIKYYMEHTIQCLLLWNRICIITFWKIKFIRW